MLRERLRSTRVGLLAALVAPVVVASCVHAPEEDDHDHSEPDGMIIRQDTIVLVEIDEQTVTGSLTVQQGEETEYLTVAFIDHDGDEIELDPSESYLSVTVVGDDIAEWLQPVAGEFGGRLRGNASGQATLSFSLVHGEVGSGHPDYISPAVMAVVTQ